MENKQKRLVLQYDQGSHSFTRLCHEATTQQLYSLAGYINQFQTEPVKRVLTVTTTWF